MTDGIPGDETEIFEEMTMGYKLTTRERWIWRVALTLANNICVQKSDRLNADDCVEEAQTAANCATAIRDMINTDDEHIGQMLREAGMREFSDPLLEALNSGDGSYRP